METEVLVCDCGDCTHWEIVRDTKGLHLHCKTCEKRHAIDHAADAVFEGTRWDKREE